MTLEVLCNMLDLPSEVSDAVTAYQNSHPHVLDDSLKKQLKSRDLWDSAIEELKSRIGEDPSGFYILSTLLGYACEAHDEYEKMGIPDSVFAETMKFCTRFLGEHKQTHGCYAFIWAWWFPRQLSLQEFRIEELEFEFVDGSERRIYIHIPSDAHLETICIQKSFTEFTRFLEKYFPDWREVDWYCDSWLLSPSLQQLLPENSRILMFQKFFEIESVNYDSMAALDWVFPGQKDDFARLSENTSLQRNMKKFLLAGGKTGCAVGKIEHPIIRYAGPAAQD